MRVAVLAAALSLSLAVQAKEGMWVPQQLPEIAGPLKAAGLELPPEQLADLTGDPMGAVVALGGCTASFVSPEGLVVTNHHCAYGAIQLNSTPEKNLMKDGFNAATQGMEPGMPVPVVITAFADRTFTFVTKTPPVTYFLKKAAGIGKGHKEPGKSGSIGKVTMAQCREIAETKMKDLNANDIEAAARMVSGSARSMGLEVVE